MFDRCIRCRQPISLVIVSKGWEHSLQTQCACKGGVLVEGPFKSKDQAERALVSYDLRLALDVAQALS